VIKKVIKAAVIAGALALLIDSIPDIKRYLEIRSM
jgi:putative N-acetylmannosamine-6-phosphate epimerase